MDTRTDPGQYYPSGRVMVRPDVAPPQIEVNWASIQGKPDFSDIAELGVADSDDNVKTAVNKIVDKLKTAVIVLMCGLCAALSASAATMLNYMSGTNEVYTAAETDAAIIRLARDATNYTDSATDELIGQLRNNEITVGMANWAENADVAAMLGGFGEGPHEVRYGQDIMAQLDAATATNAQQTAALAAKASTNDVALAPVYGGYSDWLVYIGPSVASGFRCSWFPAVSGWSIEYYFGEEYGWVEVSSYKGDIDSTDLTWTAGEDADADYRAIRHPIVIGYTLGSQTTKPLQPQGEYAPATNIAKAALASDVQTSLGKADTAVQPAALRYDLLAARPGSLSVQLADRAVLRVELSAASTTLVLPALTDLSGKVADFGIDMVNAYTPEVDGTPTPTAASLQLDGTLGTDYNLIVPKGETWSDMTALAAGEMAQFYFTLSSFQLDNIPTWKVVKQVVELVPVPSAP